MCEYTGSLQVAENWDEGKRWQSKNGTEWESELMRYEPDPK